MEASVVGRGPCAAMIALAAFGAAGGCRERGDPEASALLGNPIAAEALNALWQSHGGASAWRAVEGASFSYEVEIPGRGSIAFPSVAFRREDYRHLWVTVPGGRDPIRLDLRRPPGSIAARVAEAAPLFDGALAPAVPGGPPLLEFALRSTRYLFDLPLSSAAGGWEIHALLSPSDVAVTSILEVLPLEPSAPIGPTILQSDERSGRLSHALYAPREPYLPRIPFVVTFADYAEVGGIWVARSRAHAPAPAAGADPPDLLTHGEPALAVPLYRERIGEIRLLDAAAAGERCPLPAADSP